MLKHHVKLAEYLGIKQQPDQSEYDFRKAAFVKMFPQDALEAIELLFCVKHHTELHDNDRMWIVYAREAYNKDGEKGLLKFANGFGVDPAKPYVKEAV